MGTPSAGARKRRASVEEARVDGSCREFESTCVRSCLHFLFWVFNNRRATKSENKMLLFLLSYEMLLIIQGR